MKERRYSMRELSAASDAFQLAFKCIWIYMVINAAALATE